MNNDHEKYYPRPLNPEITESGTSYTYSAPPFPPFFSKEDLPKEEQNVESPPAVEILFECIDLMTRKNADYNNSDSNVQHADHYRRGIDTIHDQLHQKLLRAQSLIESGVIPSNESLEDTYKDMINYAAFAVLYLRGHMPGQKPDRDMYNRRK